MKGPTALPSAVQTQTPSTGSLVAAIAEAQGFELYRHYTEAQAACFIGLHKATLKKFRRSGKIAFLRLGERRVAYFGVHIAEYLINQTQPCPATQNANSNSETTGSDKSNAFPIGIEHGTIKTLDKRAALLSARRTLMKPSNF